MQFLPTFVLTSLCARLMPNFEKTIARTVLFACYKDEIHYLHRTLNYLQDLLYNSHPVYTRLRPAAEACAISGPLEAVRNAGPGRTTHMRQGRALY